MMRFALTCVVLVLVGCAAPRTKLVPIGQVVNDIEEAQRQIEADHQAKSPDRRPAGNGESLKSLLDLWMGKDVNGLIEHLGMPRKDYKMPNGNTIYEFYTEGPPRTIASQQGDVYQNITFSQYCKITVITGKKQEVLKASWIGNSCN